MKFRFLFVFIAALALASCGGNSGDTHSHGEETHSHEDAAQDGHDHGDMTADESGETHTEGKEYTSAYVCPMHCEGSGSEEPGTCPVCGMDYVARAEHIKDGHSHN
ncbi:MAG: hypothetical protein KDD06_12035 [Phaeodactylibacter sp.]|nr:hypothetical protein [Phaeodactylibacter sp.]MCB9264474.1 hypothetical protein [Lewinellaceae bacterium]MCB9286185.1 hypothetical protein [Lewinellaceae bacterium]